MEHEPFFPGRKAVTLPVKDALRGTRAMLQRASAVISPGPARERRGDAPARLAPQVATLAFEVAALLQADRHGGSDPNAGRHPFGDTERAGAAFASAIRHGLGFCFGRFGAERYLVSETLAAGAYWSGLRKLQDGDPPAMLAAHLYRSLTRHHIAAHAPGTPLGMEDEDYALVGQAIFATLIWLLVERSEPQDNEAEILGLCADVVMSLATEIAAAEADPLMLARLLASYADVI